MRPHTGPQHIQPQQYYATDNCLKPQQQQPFPKNQQQKQQQQQQQQHTVPHMWNSHINPGYYGNASQPLATTNPTGHGSAAHINLQNCRPYSSSRVYQHHTHVPHYSTNGYSPHLATTQSSERIPLTTAPNYAKLPPLSVVNQQRINECAGIPLISTATAHLTPGQRQRISRKQSHSPPVKNWSNMMANNTAQNYAQYAAAHVQGAPLMLQKQQQLQKIDYWSTHTYAAASNQHQYAAKTAMQYTNNCNNKQDRTRTPLRYQNSAPAALSTSKSKENLELQSKQTKDTENFSSTNCDSSNSNEACLPRIIKPRKRRKKDRKPPNNLVNAIYLKTDAKSLQEKSASNAQGNIKQCKSPENLIKRLQKCSQLKSLNEDNQYLSNGNKFGIIFDEEVSGKQESSAFTMTKYAGSTDCKSDINHGICFCNVCDPLRSIWDYPLRRSLSDSSTSETSGTGSLSDNANTLSKENCWPKSRAEIVGVIGSKRNKDQPNNSTRCATSNSSYFTNNIPQDNINDNSLFNNDILSGVNLASELFKYTNSTIFNTLDNPLTSTDNMVLLPETAETLLTRSINEISKKLIETCSNEATDFPLSSCNSLLSFSSTSSDCSSANSTCADFANDSGIESAHINAGDDLVFNFDNFHITTTKLSLSTSSSSSSSYLSSSSSFPTSTTSSCGNISMSSSPTVKFANLQTNFLTTQTSGTNTAATVSVITMPQQATPLTPNNVMGATLSTSSTMKAAPTLDFLVDLNNNYLNVASKAMINIENNQMHKQQQQQFNDLQQNHQLQQHQQQRQPSHQHDQKFFNNCFDLMWQQHEQQLGNNSNLIANTNTNSTSPNTTTSTNNNSTVTNPFHTNQLNSSALISNNVAMSSFLDSVGSLKTVFSTIS